MNMVVERDESSDRGRTTPAEWEKLTWNDLADWAGSRTVNRGRSYQQNGYVTGLCVSGAGVLLAWVRGGRKYVTRVHLDLTRHRRSDRIVSRCSCPVGVACKHAVAVVLEYLEAMEKGAEVPEAPEGDERWAVLGLNDDGLWEDGEDAGYAYDEGPREESGSFTRRREKRGRASEDLRPFLKTKSPRELADIILRFCEDHPELRKTLEDERRATGGEFSELLREARREMRSLTAEEAWWDGWKGVGNLPNFSGLEARLRILLDHGQADGIVELGRELLERGIDQVERSHDEGETAVGISGCMDVVAEALQKSGLSAEEKILYAIDSMLADDYGLCDDLASVLDDPWEEAVWSAVADRLTDRLEREPAPSVKGDDWLGSFRRERLSDWVITALDRGGRRHEGTRLCVAEAEKAGSYTRAVRRLLREDDFAGAERLAKAGLKETPTLYHGIHDQLQDLLCEVAEKTGDPMLPAAVAAERFFRLPSVAGLRELMERARRAGCEEVVTKEAMMFLETGRRPDAVPGGSAEGTAGGSWPLPPAPEHRGRAARPGARSGRSPHYQVLIRLAMEEKRPHDVLRWYDEWREVRAGREGAWRSVPAELEEAIAEAVASSHPDRAIDIFVEAADSVASQTNTRTYPEAGRLLKRAKRVLEKNGRSAEWSSILEDFRLNHRRKRRLMEVLDGIEDRPIVKGGRK
jgi:uncharacterized Zn finger protein